MEHVTETLLPQARDSTTSRMRKHVALRIGTSISVVGQVFNLSRQDTILSYQRRDLMRRRLTLHNIKTWTQQ
jgi:hypothetical protein